MFKKKNPGFTLIEILAVIVILAIMVVIIIPLVTNTIEKSREGSIKNSAYGIMKAAELNYFNKKTEGEKITETTYIYTNGIETPNPNDDKLEFKGKNPENGTIMVNEDGEIAIAIHDGVFCVEKGFKDKEVIILKKVKDQCIIPIPSQPELDEGMIPIKWDGTKWVKADLGQKWYDYEKKEWANVVLVTESTRNNYKTAAPGTQISETDILVYLVWIPRYKYKLFNVASEITSPQDIEIMFENKIVSKSNGNANGEWLTHPAFTFGNKELNGLWVGKFETTGDATTPTVKPGIASLRSQNVSTQFTTSQKFNNQTKYGLTSNFDSHMMKNMEWGAVAYLAQSIYGKNAEVWINPCSSFITGCAGAEPSASYSSGCSYHYTTSNGQEASTTGNVYGIYDMSGGAMENVMGGMYNSDNSTIMLTLSGFTQVTIDGTGMTKYINKYTYGTSSHDYTRRQLGDATGETEGWYDDFGRFVFIDYPWFQRGGRASFGTDAGIFHFTYDGGSASSNVSFRITIS